MAPNVQSLPNTTEQWVRRREAARIVADVIQARFTVEDLIRRHVQGTGPPFRRFGSRVPLYSPEAVRAWAQRNLSEEVTSYAQLQKVGGSGRPKKTHAGEVAK